jgi:cyclic pyranopterin monophosphate synthase
MVDVGDKPTTLREALAECLVRMEPGTLRAVKEGTPKGDALQVARVAGIMAAKRTSELIPLCHPLPLTSVTVDFAFIRGAVRILARARVVGQTGVEMEALTAAAVAGLTLIDMTKGIERGVYLESVRLLEKSGGRSGTWKRTRAKAGRRHHQRWRVSWHAGGQERGRAGGPSARRRLPGQRARGCA